MAAKDITQEMITLEHYLASKGKRWDKDAIAEVARSILAGDIDAFVELECKHYAGHDLAGLLRNSLKPIEYKSAAFWKKKELDSMSWGREFDSSVLKQIMIRLEAETPAMPEPSEPEIYRPWAHLIDSPNPKGQPLYKRDAKQVRDELTPEQKRMWAREATVRNESKTKAGLEMGVGESCIRQYLNSQPRK